MEGRGQFLYASATPAGRGPVLSNAEWTRISAGYLILQVPYVSSSCSFSSSFAHLTAQYDFQQRLAKHKEKNVNYIQVLFPRLPESHNLSVIFLQ